MLAHRRELIVNRGEMRANRRGMLANRRKMPANRREMFASIRKMRANREKMRAINLAMLRHLRPMPGRNRLTHSEHEISRPAARCYLVPMTRVVRAAFLVFLAMAVESRGCSCITVPLR